MHCGPTHMFHVCYSIHFLQSQQALIVGYMQLDGVRRSCPTMLVSRLKQVSDTNPVDWKLWREISSSITQVTQDMERSSLNELRLNEVEGISNEALVNYYESTAPESRSGKRKLHGSSPTRLWKKNGPEMTCLATIADLKAHEAKQAAAAEEKADRKTRRFVNQVFSCTHNDKLYSSINL